jgi:inosine triphosphate pyrophosphatase
MNPLTFVTGNPNKVLEVHAILGDAVPVQPRALDIPEIQGTLEEIASDKCRRAAQMVGALWLHLCGGTLGN